MKEELVRVIVCNDGVTAKELNRYGDKPLMGEPPYQPFYAPYGMSEIEFHYEQAKARNSLLNFEFEYEQAVNEWKIIEDSLRTFDICYGYIENLQSEVDSEERRKVPLSFLNLKPNSIHLAKIIDNKKIKIIINQ